MNINTKISALIITKNEAHNIVELIKNLSFVDEIIIVDSFSTDATEELATKFDKVKFYKHKFENYASQRNIALGYATNSWILFLDADERLTPALSAEIQETLKNPTADAYFFYRTYYYKNKPMHFTGLQADKNIRLFKKEVGTYTGLVHEKLMVEGKIASLKNKLIHYSFHDYESYKEKLKNYGKLKAKEKFSKGEKYNIFKHYAHSTYCFLNRFFFRLGFLDGKKGAVVSYLMAYSIWERYTEIKRLRKK